MIRRKMRVPRPNRDTESNTNSIHDRTSEPFGVRRQRSGDGALDLLMSLFVIFRDVMKQRLLSP